VVDLATHFSSTALAFFARDAVYLVNPNQIGHRISRDHHLSARETDTAHLPKIIIKAVILEPKPAVLERIKLNAHGLPADMANSLPYA
jgi:hypothetical protein